jgi:hypothetical protein
MIPKSKKILKLFINFSSSNIQIKIIIKRASIWEYKKIKVQRKKLSFVRENFCLWVKFKKIGIILMRMV